MRRLLVTILLCGSSFAQYGTAPANYYPVDYHGSTFTGKVTKAEGNDITLTYVNGNKSTVFVGRMQNGCSVPRADGANKPMMAGDVPVGSVITAFFNSSSVKVNGEKQKLNEIIAISFVEFNGGPVDEQRRRIYNCSNGKMGTFKTF